ncbi:MAG TPA: O-antigen ligase family protein [Candidatus Enteromonas pullicola]|uniref:O-antigen ligase family protein n=1 Tax=Candidatus Alloenteromonas pullicola TaxID=2840784 RepID=A0A9D1LMU2_9FIRM|nr:O-antigen ligase family protein [Candidatus Enteromonas pullicola]
MHRRRIDWSIVGVGRARKGNTPYLLLLLLGLMSVSVGAYFEEAIAFFNTPNYVLMDDVEFFLTMAACLASMALFLIVAIRKGSLKANYLFIGLFGLLIASNAVGLLAFPSSIDGFTHHLDGTKTAFSYSIDAMDRVRFMILFVVGMGYLYVLFCVLPQLLKDGRSLMFLFYAAAFVSFFAIAWSIGMEWPIYAKYFSIKTEVTASVYVSSFFYNRNLFGMMLVIGICSLIFIHNHHPHWWNFLLISILFTELFFVISKTSILIALLAAFAFLIYRFVLTIRLHWRRNLITLFFFLAAPLAVFLLGFYKTLGENFIFSKMVDNLLLAFEGTDAGSVKSRFDIWYASIMMLSDSPIRWIFGVGESNFGYLLGKMFDIDKPSAGGIFYAHNGFVHVLCSGGVVRLAVYLFLLVYFLYVAFKAFRRHSKSAFPCLVFFVGFLIHGMAESTAFLMTDTKAFMIVLMAYVPLLADYNRYVLKRPLGRQEDYEAVRAEDLLSVRPLLIASSCLSIGLGALLPILLGPVGIYPHSNIAFLSVYGTVGGVCLGLSSLSLGRKGWGYAYLAGILAYVGLYVALVFFPNAFFFALAISLQVIFGAAGAILGRGKMAECAFPLAMAVAPVAISSAIAFPLAYCLHLSLSSYAALFALCYLLYFAWLAAFPSLLGPLPMAYFRLEGRLSIAIEIHDWRYIEKCGRVYMKRRNRRVNRSNKRLSNASMA